MYTLYRNLIYILFFATTIGVGIAQPSKLGFGANGQLIGLPSSQFYNGTANCSVWLKNCDSQQDTINGFLRIAVDSLSGPLAFLQKDTFNNIIIPPGDSSLFSFTITIQYGYFRVGSNILVIWPHLNNSNIQLAGCDTLTGDTIIVLNNYLGQPEHSYNDDKRVLISPNPSSDVINFRLSNHAFMPYNIIITDLYGREIINAGEYISEVDISRFAPGTYFVNFYYTDKRKSVSRLIKSAR